MPVLIRKVEYYDDSGSPSLRLYYVRPDHDAGADHSHYIPIQAIVHRYSVMGLETMEEAIEEIIHEAIAAHMLGPEKADKWPGKADRNMAKQAHGPVNGLAKALKDAGIAALNPPDDKTQARLQTDFLLMKGQSELARMRGVALDEVPVVPPAKQVMTPAGPRGERPELLAPLPKVKRDRPVHPNAPT